MKYPIITIGTRGSSLALAQTELVKALLLGVDAALDVRVRVIKTEGDTNTAPVPADVVGKGWFTKEIERALQVGEIDLAVHSLKDLPEQLGEGLTIGAIPEREDARDVLVSKSGATLANLPSNAVVGTDSPRRKVQVLAARPDLKVESIRGNVPTRLEKLATQNYDALVLAAAGLHRLGLQNRITEYLAVDVVTPAPGQGAMAIEMKAGDGELGAIVAKCSHAQTAAAVGAERAFSAAVGGGCKQPVGAYATCDGDALTLVGMMVNNSGAIVRSTLTGKTADAASIGKNLAAQLVENAGR